MECAIRSDLGRRLRRTRPPGPTALVGVVGDPDHITVSWSPNSEPDLAGYQIYRGVCDHGYLYLPGVTWVKDKEGRLVRKGESRFRCDMTLVGDVRARRRRRDVRSRRVRTLR